MVLGKRHSERSEAQSRNMFYSSDFNTTSLNWWMETAVAGGRATPEHGNATGFNRWLFTYNFNHIIK
jgi:hypothetical protein